MMKKRKTILGIWLMLLVMFIFGTEAVWSAEFTDGAENVIFSEESIVFESGEPDEIIPQEIMVDEKNDVVIFEEEMESFEATGIEEEVINEEIHGLDAETVIDVAEENGSQTYAEDVIKLGKTYNVDVSDFSKCFIADETCYYIVEFQSQEKVHLEFGHPDTDVYISRVPDCVFSVKLEKGTKYRVQINDEFDTTGKASFKMYKSDLQVEHDREQDAVYGQSKTLKVQASSSSDKITYEWYEFAKIKESGERAFKKIGATEAKCKISAVTAPIYKCEITDGNGCNITAFFNLTLDTGLSGEQREFQEWVEVREGEDLVLKVPVNVADGVEVKYEWQSNGYGIFGEENGDSLELKNIKKEEIDTYICTVTDEFSNSVIYYFFVSEYIPRGFEIETDYQKVFVNYGEDAVLAPKVIPDEEGVQLTYTWELINWEGRKKLTDKSTETYTVKNNKNDSGTYVCTISDGQGTEKAVEFFISVQHKWSVLGSSYRNIYISKGNDVKLNVKINNGDGYKLTYKWFKVNYIGSSFSSNIIDGAVKSSYTVKNIQDLTEYICEVSDEYGNRDSVHFSIRPGEEWYIDYNKTRSRFCADKGMDIKLKVYVTAPDNLKLSYQWKISGGGNNPSTVISGATKSTYVVKNVRKNMNLFCTVTDQYGNERNEVFMINLSWAHSWESKPSVDKKATCLKEGKQSIHCSVCDKIKEGTTEKTPISDHSWGKGNVLKEATYEEEGLQEKTCTVCNKKKTEVIKKKEITSLPKPESFKVSGKTSAKDGKTERKVELSWKAVKYADGYRVYRKIDNGKWETIKKLSGNDKTSFTDTDVNAGKGYSYRVRAYYSGSSKWVGGEYTDAEDVVFKPDETELTGTEATAYNQVKITWGAVEAADGYYIYRRNKGGSWKKLADVKNKSEYLDKSVEPGEIYRYRVRAYCTVEGKKVWGGYSSSSEEMTTKLEKGKIISLKSSSRQNVIKWEAVPGAEMYQIYCKIGKDGSYKKIKATSSLSYTHKKLDKGTKYYYKVRAYRKNSEGKKCYSSYTGVKSVTCK